MEDIRDFDEATERLMIANDPSLTRLRVEPSNPRLPNLAKRLGHALNQTSYIKTFRLDLKSFDEEEDDSSMLLVLQWIATSSFLTVLVLNRCSGDLSKRNWTSQRWFHEALCNRSMLSLPLKELGVLNLLICARTVVRILQACQPEVFHLLSGVHDGTFASRTEAVEHVRRAFEVNTSLRLLSLHAQPQCADYVCAILESLPAHVDLDKVAFCPTLVNGQTVTPHHMLDALVARLQTNPTGIRIIEFAGFSWTGSTLASILDYLLPCKVQHFSFVKCTFLEASSSELLTFFNSSADQFKGLCLYRNFTFPISIPVMERLTGSSPGLTQLDVFEEATLYFDGILAGLISKPSSLKRLHFQALLASECKRLLDALPYIGNLELLAITLTAVTRTLKQKLFRAARRNGSITQYMLKWPGMTMEETARLRRYGSRNAHLVKALMAVARNKGKSDADRFNHKVGGLPSLLYSVIEATSAASGIKHVLAFLCRSEIRVASNQKRRAPCPLLSMSPPLLQSASVPIELYTESSCNDKKDDHQLALG